VSLGTNLDTTWTLRARKWMRFVEAFPDPVRLLAPIVPLFADADVVLVNVEGAIGDGPAEAKCPPGTKNCFALRQPVAAAHALRTLSDSGVVVGNLANNHSHDAGLDGLTATVQNLTAAGVLVAGVDTMATVVGTASGDTVAILGFGTSGIPDARDLEAVQRYVARAAARYPHVVVTMHLGAEGASAQAVQDSSEEYAGEQRGNPVAFARAATESGAELVVGHGPHVVRAMEWRGDALVAYSLGNLATYGPFSLLPPLDRGVILCATLGRKHEVSHVVLRPTRQRPPGKPLPDRSARALRLVDSLARAQVGRAAPRMLLEGRLLKPVRDSSGVMGAARP